MYLAMVNRVALAAPIARTTLTTAATTKSSLVTWSHKPIYLTTNPSKISTLYSPFGLACSSIIRWNEYIDDKCGLLKIFPVYNILNNMKN